MKKNKLFFLLLCFLSIIFSCKKGENSQELNELTKQKQSLQSFNFVSPNKIVIATGESDLKNKIERAVNNKFQEHTSFSLKSIDFLNVNTGAIANIHFKTTKGIESNVIYIAKYPLNKVFTENKPLSINVANTANQPPVTITCSGGTCCQVHVHIDDSGVHINCSCDPCTATVS